MQQFSLYHTAEGLLYKTTCLLVEKSYHSNLRIVVLTPDIEVQESLNKMIWTYSRKQFIPHGSKLDPLPEKQPVYITHQLENPNQASILIIIAPFDIEEILNNKQYVAHFQRIIIIYDGLDNLSLIVKAINELTIATPVIDCYKQSPIGTWSKI
ncbi:MULTISPECIES: DNA polymerase III subunit chi [unclassified Candidatus Tisiphia]|uniref:DNA polymerase III subunit chi n=1 Tax=unclassified Candidatus Tisiphia TaxID=2996318 RepID=UPI0035C8F2C9